jgi:hypothetical protein
MLGHMTGSDPLCLQGVAEETGHQGPGAQCQRSRNVHDAWCRVPHEACISEYRRLFQRAKVVRQSQTGSRPR